MAVFLGVHTGVTRSEYKEMKDKLQTALPNSKILTMENVSILYDTSKKFTVTNSAVRDDSFVSVYYKNAQAASECGLHAEVSSGVITFTFDSEPSEEIVCTIMITQKGGV